MIEADLLLQINFEDLIKDFATIEAGIFISVHDWSRFVAQIYFEYLIKDFTTIEAGIFISARDWSRFVAPN